MNRRDVIKLLSLAGLAAICPAGVSSVTGKSALIMNRVALSSGCGSPDHAIEIFW